MDIHYRDEWKNEIISHFGNITNCAKQFRNSDCKIHRSNISRSCNASGYISEKMLIAICQKMDLAPICFIDLKMHDHFYNDEYKMSFQEYKTLLKSNKIMKTSGSKKKNDKLTPTLQLWAGLTDIEVAALPDSVKLKLSLQISKLISETLQENLPGWC